MNNNKTSAQALEGLFQRSQFVFVGTKDNPLPYDERSKASRTNHLGKQFGTAAPKHGNTNDVYFEKEHKWLQKDAKYVDHWDYSETQTERKTGFLDSDFSKRDEFTNTIRTEQYRQQVKQETKFTRKAMEEQMGITSNSWLAQQIAEEAATLQANKPALYDLVFEQADPHACPYSKTHRETKNPTALSRERHTGALLSTSAAAFVAPAKLSKPEFGHKPAIRDSFMRRTNPFPTDPTASSNVP